MRVGDGEYFWTKQVIHETAFDARGLHSTRAGR